MAASGFSGGSAVKPRDGVLLFGVPVRVLDTLTTESDMREELRRIVSSVFVPYVGIEYIDVGGEPIGFNELYGTSFGGESLESFFTHPLDKSRRHEG